MTLPAESPGWSLREMATGAALAALQNPAYRPTLTFELTSHASSTQCAPNHIAAVCSINSKEQTAHPN